MPVSINDLILEYFRQHPDQDFQHGPMVGQASVLAQTGMHRSEQDSRLQSEQGRLCHQGFMRPLLNT